MSDLHLNFLRLHPIQAKLIIFRVLTVRILLRIFKKIKFPQGMQTAFTPPSTLSLSLRIMVCHQNTLHTARLLGPCFKTGWREENFKRASSLDWWAKRTTPNNQETINCRPTSDTAANPEHRLKLFSSAHAGSFEAPSSNILYECPLWNPFSSHARCPFSQAHSKPCTCSSSSHSVPSMQFQVLLTCLSAFFSTFLRSTFPLSVFMSYLDLGEIYLLLYAEITINVTLKEAEIWEHPEPTREFHPLCCSFPTDFQFFLPHLATSSKGASVRRLYCRRTLFLWSVRSSFATTRRIMFIFFSPA